MAKQQQETQNLLDFKPARLLRWETEGNEQVILLVPKFRTGPFAQWLMKKLPKPFIRVKLDPYGSFVWNMCDGQTTVFAISEKMKEKFGEDFDPNYRRVGQFIAQLIRDKFVSVDQPVPAP